MPFPRRINGFNLGSYLAKDAAQVRSSNGFACPLGSRLHSRLIRSASPARSGGRCSSAATSRFQTEADPAQTASPRSLLLDCTPPSVFGLDRGPDHREAGNGGFLASGRLSLVLAVAVSTTSTRATAG